MSIVMELGCDFRPKSLLVVLIDVLIYLFHTHFDRGLKVRLFCSPQWHRTDKRSRYNAELLSLFQMYSSVVGELYHNMVAERSARAYDDVVKLRAYTMENLHAIKARYSSRDSRYDKYVRACVN